MAAKLLCVLGAFEVAHSASILQWICSNDDLATLCNVSQSYPNIVTALNGTGNLTLFAPKEGSFPSPLPDRDTVEKILLYHVIGAKVMSTDLVDLQFPPSLDSDLPLKIKKDADGVKIEFCATNDCTAMVTVPDNEATNGVVHIVDKLLLPPQSAANVANATGLSTLLGAVVVSNLTDAVNSATTIFAPTNEAFAAANIANFSIPATVDTLKYHVVLEGNPLFSTTINGTTNLTTALGDILTVTATADGVFVNGVKVETADVLTEAGVVHVVGAVIPVPFNPALSILENLNRQGPFTDLTNAVEGDADVKDFLSTASDITVFAPVNEAFADALPNVSMTALLTYHVASSAILSSAIPAKAIVDSSLTDASAVNLGEGIPQKLVVTNVTGTVMINGAAQVGVGALDAMSSDNVVLHGLDAVLAPPAKPAAVMANTPFLTTLLELVVAAGLADAVTTTAGITVLAPTNDAFKEFQTANNVPNLTANISVLQNILLGHVFSTAVYSDMVTDGLELEALNGQNWTVYVNNMTGEVKFNNSVLNVADVLIWNGVVHVIDCVLGQTCPSGPPSTPTPSPSGGDGDGLSTGAVVGIVIGVLVGVAIIGYCCFKSSKRDDDYQRV